MDLTYASKAAGDAHVRAGRALDRFQNVPAGDATEEAVSALLDRFFEAAEAIWHIKDWIIRYSPAEDHAAVNAATNAEPLATVRLIANASKHSGLDKAPNRNIKLHVVGVPRGSVQSLAELYRKLSLDTEQGHIHPADFLEQCMEAWAEFAGNQFGAFRYF